MTVGATNLSYWRPAHETHSPGASGVLYTLRAMQQAHLLADAADEGLGVVASDGIADPGVLLARVVGPVLHGQHGHEVVERGRLLLTHPFHVAVEGRSGRSTRRVVHVRHEVLSKTVERWGAKGEPMLFVEQTGDDGIERMLPTCVVTLRSLNVSYIPRTQTVTDHNVQGNDEKGYLLHGPQGGTVLWPQFIRQARRIHMMNRRCRLTRVLETEHRMQRSTAAHSFAAALQHDKSCMPTLYEKQKTKKHVALGLPSISVPSNTPHHQRSYIRRTDNRRCTHRANRRGILQVVLQTPVHLDE